MSEINKHSSQQTGRGAPKDNGELYSLEGLGVVTTSTKAIKNPQGLGEPAEENGVKKRECQHEDVVKGKGEKGHI